MNKLMYRFVTTTKKKKKEIDPFLDTVCPLRASRVKRNRPVFRHGMPLQGNPRNNGEQDACHTGITRDAGADSFIPTVCFAD